MNYDDNADNAIESLQENNAAIVSLFNSIKVLEGIMESLKFQRDEARRMYCIRTAQYSNQTSRQVAESMGWDYCIPKEFK